MRKLVVVTVIMLSSGTGNASNKKSCQQDQIKFCNGKLDRACLMGHINEVSANCKTWLEASTVGKAAGVKNQAVGNVTDVKAACSSDIAKHCASTALTGSYGKCLKQNYDKLSAGCKQAVDQSKTLK